MNKHNITGFSGHRLANTDEQIKLFLQQNGFEVYEALCDIKKIAAQRDDIYFFSDFETPKFSRVLSRNFGFFAFSAPEIRASGIACLAKALAAILGLKRQTLT